MTKNMPAVTLTEERGLSMTQEHSILTSNLRNYVVELGISVNLPPFQDWNMNHLNLIAFRLKELPRSSDTVRALNLVRAIAMSRFGTSISCS